MIRPALTSLLALAVALPAHADGRAKRCADSLAAIAKDGRASVMTFPAGADKWETDLEAVQPDGPLCDDAVWRLVDQPGARAKWGAAATAQAQAQVLGGAGAALDGLDADVAALEAAAAKVYEVGAAAKVSGAAAAADVAIKRAKFKSAVIGKGSPTQIDPTDADKASAAMAERQAALRQLVTPPPPPAKGAKPSAPSAAQPGAVVAAYYKALDKVREDVLAAAKLGLLVPKLTPIFAPSTNKLADNYLTTIDSLAKADKWDDAAAHASAMDLLGDRALRNRVAMHSANVRAIYQEALNGFNGVGTQISGIDKKKKEKLDELNAKLRAGVNTSIGYDAAKQAFDNDASHNGDYAESEEGRYRAGELAQAKTMADTAEIAARADGKGYQLQYKTADGQVHVVAGKDNIPDLKTAESSLNDLTSSLASKILDDHKLLAKTQAALEAAKGGATTFGDVGLAAPMGPVAEAGCDKKGESLAEYQKRLRDKEMEGAADSSAKRQGPLKKYKDALQAADDQYKVNMANGMNADVAKRVRDNAKDAAKKEYLASTQAVGSMDDQIAARSARIATINDAAQASFVESIKMQAPQLAQGMRGHLKKYVPEGAAKTLLVAGGSDDGKSTLYEQFIAEEWTVGNGNISKNAEACKNEVREGDYGSLEKCAGKTLKDWLAARKRGKIEQTPSVDDQVRETERSR